MTQGRGRPSPIPLPPRDLPAVSRPRSPSMPPGQHGRSGHLLPTAAGEDIEDDVMNRAFASASPDVRQQVLALLEESADAYADREEVAGAQVCAIFTSYPGVAEQELARYQL